MGAASLHREDSALLGPVHHVVLDSVICNFYNLVAGYHDLPDLVLRDLWFHHRLERLVSGVLGFAARRLVVGFKYMIRAG